MSDQGHALPGEDLITIEEAARHVGLSVRTLRRYQSSGRLAVVKVGRNVMCTRAAAERATRSGGLELAYQRLVEPEWDSRAVREWMAAWADYVRMVPPEGRSPEFSSRYVEMVADRFGELPVRSYLLKHLGEVHKEAKDGGFDVLEVGMMLALPEDTPVIDAVRHMQFRFAGRLIDGQDAQASLGTSGPRSTAFRGEF